MTRMSSATLTLPLFAALLCACGTQTDDDFRGETLLHLTGQVVNEQPIVPAAGVTMVWTYDTGSGDFSVGEAVEVSGGFPANFTLDLFEPPAGIPAAAFATIGLITALPPDTTELPDEDALLGIDEQHVVVYLSRDVADLPAEQHDAAVAVLGGELTTGYHLMEVTPGSDVFDDMTKVLSTSSITVRMAPVAELRIPNVF